MPKTTAPIKGREQLLRATITVVARGGLRQLTYRSVAQEAGVAHSLVRHHFGSLTTLIGEALSYAVERSLADSNMTTGSSNIDDFAAGLGALAERDGELQAFQYELILESRRRPELTPHIEEYYKHYRQATAKELHRLGVDDEALIELIWFTMDALVFKSVALGERSETGRVIDRLRRLIREHAKEPVAADAE